MRNEVAAPRISWPLLLVSSYASALTVVLGFILWTGRGLSRLDFSPPSIPSEGTAAFRRQGNRPSSNVAKSERQ